METLSEAGTGLALGWNWAGTALGNNFLDWLSTWSCVVIRTPRVTERRTVLAPDAGGI